MALTEETKLLIRLSAEDATKKAFSDIGKSLSGLATTALKVAAAVGAAFAFKELIGTTRQWNKELDLLVDTLGVTGAEAAKLNFIGRTIGLTAEDTAGAFGILSRRISEQAVQIRAGTSTFDKWGVKVTDAKGNILSFDDILGNINKTVGQMPSGLAKTAAEMDLFGKSGKQMHDLVSLTREEIAAMGDDVDRLGLSMSTGGVAAAEQFDRQFNRLGLTFDAFKITIGNALLPLLANLIAKFVTWAKDVLPRLKEQLGPIVSAIGNLAMAVFNLFGALGRVIGAILRVITGERDAANLTKVWGEALRRIASFLKEVADAADRFAKLIGDEGIVAALKQLGGDLLTVVMKFLGDIGEKLDSFGVAGTLAKDALLAIGSIAVLGKLAEVVTAVAGIPAALLKIPAKTLVTVDVVLIGVAIGEIAQNVKLIADNWDLLRLAQSRGMLENKGPVEDFLARLVIWGNMFDALGTKTQQSLAWWGQLFSSFGTGVKKVFDDIGSWWNQTVYDITVKLNQLILKLNEVAHTSLPTIGTGNPATGTGGPASGHSGDQDNPGAGRQMTQPDCGPGFTAIKWADGHWTCEVTQQSGRPMAAGGIVTRPTRALIGEAGPEAVIPLDRGGGLGSTVINITVSNNLGLDEAGIARMVGDEVMRTLGRSRGLAY